MDLTRMMAEEPLANLDWLQNAETFEPADKDINTKDDLAVEWGRGSVNSPEDLPPTTIEDEMDVEMPWQATESCVAAARVLMHQGFMHGDLVAALRTHFAPDVIKAAIPELKKLTAAEGIIGCVALDLRGQKDHEAALKASRRSPYKRFISYVLMTPEQIESSALVERHYATRASMENGSIDGLLGNDERRTMEQAVYKPLNMPIIVMSSGPHEESISDENYGTTMLELAQFGELNDDEIKEIESRESADNFEKLRQAFRLVNRKRKAKATADMNRNVNAADKANDYAMEASIVTAEVGNAPTPEIETFGVDVASLTVESDREVEKVAVEDVEVQHVEQEDIVLAAVAEMDLDIDPSVVLDPEFEGISDIGLDEPAEQIAPLDIEETAEIDFG